MKEKIIVSLTTFPGRIGTVHKTIETILANTKLPDKIVLYLAAPQFPGKKLPTELKSLIKENPLVEVRYHKTDIRPYKKLIPALTDFPNDCIITIDDDLIYPTDLISKLWRCHRRYPKAICGRRVRRADTMDTSRWKLYRFMRVILWGRRPKLNNLATSGGGTLFPPNALYKDAIREDIFMRLAPTTDDLWYWAMAVAGGTKTAVASRSLHLEYVPGSQDESLWHINCGAANQNQKNLEAIADKYPAVKKLLES